MLPVLHTLGIEGAADNLVTDTGKIADATSADQNNGVLLQVVPDTGDVGGDLDDD